MMGTWNWKGFLSGVHTVDTAGMTYTTRRIRVVHAQAGLIESKQLAHQLPKQCSIIAPFHSTQQQSHRQSDRRTNPLARGWTLWFPQSVALCYPFWVAIAVAVAEQGPSDHA